MGPRKKPTRTQSRELVSSEYADMVREYRRESKRQRLSSVEPKLETPTPVSDNRSVSPRSLSSSSPPPGTIDLESDSDYDSDEFEDVELDSEEPAESSVDPENPNTAIMVSIDANKANHLSRRQKKAGLSKPGRLLLHKLSLIAWMYHCRSRNAWLADPTLLQNPLLRKVPESILAEVHPPEHLTPFLRSKQFIEGLRHLMEVWQHRFRVVRPGLASVMDEGDELGDPNSSEEYYSCLLQTTGSADLEAQGFVAFLRSLGIQTRLVCSFQPPDNLMADTTSLPVKSGTGQGAAGATAFSSKYPIFWAEAWDSHVNRWVAVDTVTSTLRLPTRNKVKLKLEPPQSDKLNIMRYCIALNSDNSGRDVTRRYSSNYNARTRKKRLTYIESEEWLLRFLGKFAPQKYTDADKEEIRELARYPLLEGIPSRAQDFVGHPEYALADHLRHNEVLKPGADPCGILSAKTKGSKPPAKPSYIYSRKDVLVARSAQSWYKRGRSIKIGVQPRGRRARKNRLTGETESVALYTLDQTELYKPPAVEPDGTVPKSQYRTIDVFTDTMIPDGGYYIKSKFGKEAARLLKVDFANVVTRVEYGRRGPQSHMFGVIVAKQFVPAMKAVIAGLHEQERDQAERREELRILMLWRKFIMGVQIWERVEKMNPSSSALEGAGNISDRAAKWTNYSVETNGSPVSTEEIPETPIEAGASHASHPEQAKRIYYVRTAALTEFLKRSQRIKSQKRMTPESAAAAAAAAASAAASAESRHSSNPFESPGSYNSFSDIDVDEISESEL